VAALLNELVVLLIDLYGRELVFSHAKQKRKINLKLVSKVIKKLIFITENLLSCQCDFHQLAYCVPISKKWKCLMS
jgi:uncharacterized membrane protein YoaT (DUF817 family)